MIHRYIIERPELQTLVQRYSSAWLTLIFWVLYLYLWTPLITLIAWVLQVGLARHEMVELQGYLLLIDRMSGYGIVILGIFVSLIGWAEYNYQRFRSVDRRNTPGPVTKQDLARYFEVPLPIVDAWQQAKTLNIYLDENGRVVPSSTVRGRLARVATKQVV
ncbi:MAG: poly-beta-1,6-N-acetyl-D-glucosamine biosynthesis protein PgaD [Gammaproteobacteria bacterium]